MIYLDHAAGTPLDPRVLEAMQPFLTTEFGNPSSLNSLGKRAKQAVDEARAMIAKLLGCRVEEIIFTSGGTESINLAIQGVCWGQRKKGKNHIITTNAEHAAVLETCKHMEDKGFKVTYLPVNNDGMVSAQQVREAIRDDTVLITIMSANNELGSINPISEIAAVAKEHQIDFHTDACQANYLEWDVTMVGASLVTLNGYKMYGPKGIGVLYRKFGTPMQPVVYGGGQEFKLRPGTENVPAIVGMAKAMELMAASKKDEANRIEVLRDRLETNLLAKIPDCKVNGANRIPCTLNISIKGVESEAVLLYLDEQGIQISSGSACQSNAIEPSHVLTAIGLADEFAHGTLRFSLGRGTTQEDIDKVVAVLPGIVESLRKISPMY